MPEIGLAMATWAEQNGQDADDGASALDRIRLVVADETTIASGGLLIHDTATGGMVTPGCCGLEDWREWSELCTGGEPWLGHDPTPRVEHHGSIVRLWPSGGDAELPPSGDPVEVPVAELPALMQSAQEQLAGFLLRVGSWAREHVPSIASDLVAKLDRDLSITGAEAEADQPCS